MKLIDYIRLSVMASANCVKYTHLKTHCPVCVELNKHGASIELLPAKVNSTRGATRYCTCNVCGTSFTAYAEEVEQVAVIEKPVKSKVKSKKKSRRKKKK